MTTHAEVNTPDDPCSYYEAGEIDDLLRITIELMKLDGYSVDGAETARLSASRQARSLGVRLVVMYHAGDEDVPPHRMTFKVMPEGSAFSAAKIGPVLLGMNFGELRSFTPSRDAAFRATFRLWRARAMWELRYPGEEEPSGTEECRSDDQRQRFESIREARKEARSRAFEAQFATENRAPVGGEGRTLKKKVVALACLAAAAGHGYWSSLYSDTSEVGYRNALLVVAGLFAFTAVAAAFDW